MYGIVALPLSVDEGPFPAPLLGLLDPVTSTTATTGVFLDGHQAHGDELVDPPHDLLSGGLVILPCDLLGDLLGGDLRRNALVVSDRGEMFEYAEREVVDLPGRDLPGLLADGRRRSDDEALGQGAELVFDGTKPIGDDFDLFFSATIRPCLKPLASKGLKKRREIGLRAASFTSNAK